MERNMKPRWMLVALVTATLFPVSAYSQTPGVAWPQGYYPCVVPQRQLYDPFGQPLEPNVVYCSEAYDCTEMISHTGTQQTTVSIDDSPAVLELQEKVRKLEVRVRALDGKAD